MIQKSVRKELAHTSVMGKEDYYVCLGAELQLTFYISLVPSSCKLQWFFSYRVDWTQNCITVIKDCLVESLFPFSIWFVFSIFYLISVTQHSDLNVLEEIVNCTLKKKKPTHVYVLASEKLRWEKIWVKCLQQMYLGITMVLNMNMC